MMKSANLVVTGKDYNQYSGKVSFPFRPNFKVTNQDIALITATFNNSFFNVSLGRRSIVLQFPKYTGPNAFDWVTYTLLIPDGFYEIHDFDQRIQHFCIQNNLYLIDNVTGRFVYFVRLYANANEYRIQFDNHMIPTATQLVTLDWSVPAGSTSGIVNPGAGDQMRSPTISFNDQLVKVFGVSEGFTTVSTVSVDPVWDPSPSSKLGDGVPKVNPVTAVIVRCNLVNNGYANPSDILGVCPVTSVFGAVNQMILPIPTFTPAVPGEHGSCEISFMDQDLNKLFMFDSDMTFTIQIREPA